MGDILNVKLTRQAIRDLKKVPLYITIKFQAWVEAVGNDGLSNVRKISGFHDEPLKGRLKGFRSIRLSSAYRAIYIVKKDKLEFIEVQEVNKHDY